MLTVLTKGRWLARAAPFHCTTDDATNPPPLTVSVEGAGSCCCAYSAGSMRALASGFAEISERRRCGTVPPPGAAVTTCYGRAEPVLREIARRNRCRQFGVDEIKVGSNYP